MICYLYTAVKNRALNYLRHQEVEKRSAGIVKAIAGSARTPDEELNEKEIEEAVNSAIEELPEHCRQIFMLRKYDNLSYSEIAEIHQISINTVKTQMSRSVKFLLKRLAHIISSFPSIFSL